MPQDRSNVIVFPPLIPITGFLLGVVLDRVVPLASGLSASTRGELRAAGAVVLGIGLVGFAWMVITMKRAHTPINNARPATTLVETGPFRWSRNPMYLFGTVAYVGLALLLVELWPLILVPAVLLVTHHGVVLREEASLSRQFGDSYDRYRARVRRWL